MRCTHDPAFVTSGQAAGVGCAACMHVLRLACCDWAGMHEWHAGGGGELGGSGPQVPNQAALVQCDAALAALLGGEVVVKMSSLSARIGALLQPLPPPTLHYTVKCAQAPLCCPYLVSLSSAPCKGRPYAPGN